MNSRGRVDPWHFPGAGTRPYIGTVAAARELTGLVFYGLRDLHIRALPAPQSA